jgi:rare lipoprotein A
MRTMVPTLALVGFLLAGGVTEAQGWSSRVGQVGWASWYGKFHHGRPTAGGECCSMYRLTAAHRTLPLGTTVVVTNLQTRQQVVVRITDRGPYVEPRPPCAPRAMSMAPSGSAVGADVPWSINHADDQ